jgi:hypothetical protein
MTSKRFGQFSHLINFVYLAKNSYSPNTAKSYIAAIGFKMKMNTKSSLKGSKIPWELQLERYLLPVPILWISEIDHEKGHQQHSYWQTKYEKLMKMNNLTDSTDSFIVNKLLKGMSKTYKRADIRRPITVEILADIIIILPQICN